MQLDKTEERLGKLAVWKEDMNQRWVDDHYALIKFQHEVRDFGLVYELHDRELSKVESKVLDKVDMDVFNDELNSVLESAAAASGGQKGVPMPIRGGGNAPRAGAGGMSSTDKAMLKKLTQTQDNI